MANIKKEGYDDLRGLALDNLRHLTLTQIEEELIVIEEEKHRRIHNAKEDYSGSLDDMMEADEIDYLDVKKAKLKLMRQFILDKRHNWKTRIFWGIIAPIIVATITAYLVSVFIH